MKLSSIYMLPMLMIACLLLCGCVTEQQVMESEVRVAQVEEQTHQIGRAHPEVEETLVRLSDLHQTLELMASVKEDRDKTLKKFESISFSEGPIKMEFLP